MLLGQVLRNSLTLGLDECESVFHCQNCRTLQFSVVYLLLMLSLASNFLVDDDADCFGVILDILQHLRVKVTGITHGLHN